MSEAASKTAKNGERSSKYGNSVNRTTSETLRVTDVEGGSATSQVPPSQRQKKSSFQITSVVTATRMSNDGGEDSADDLDESHTEDISDVVDNSRVTDIENETPSYSEDTFSKDDVFFNPSSTSFGTAPVIPTSSQYGLAIVSTNDPNNIIQSNANDININDSSNVINITNVKNAENELGRETTHVTRNERFKVVKIESTEPFKRGRWQCMDYLDHTMLHHHPQQTVINIKNEVSDTQNQNPLVQNSFAGPDGGIQTNDTHEEVENYSNPSHTAAQNMQNSLQNSVSPGQSVHNLQISIPKANANNPIPSQNINQQQMMQAQAQSMSHSTVPMQQNVQQTQSLPHQQMQQVISQANFQQQNSTQPQNIQNQSQPHPPIQSMPSQINQTQSMPQPQQMNQTQQHPQINQPQGTIQQQHQQQQQQQHPQIQIQQLQQQMMQNNSMSQAQINHNIQQYYPTGNQASIMTNQNQMIQNQQVVPGGPAMMNQQGHLQQANMSHVTQATQQMHQGQNMMNMGQQMGHTIQQYQNQTIPVQMQQQLQQNYNQQMVQNQIQQVPTQNPSMGGYVMPTNAIQNQPISQSGQIMQNQTMQQQTPSQTIQQTSALGNQMPQLMQQSGQIMQGGAIIPQPQQAVLSGGPSNTSMQGQPMLQTQNYQNFTQTQQNVGMSVGGTPSSNQPISYSNAVPASATANNQNQAITYSTAPISVNQAMGYNSQAGTSQTPVIPFTTTNINQQMTYSTQNVNITQPGQSSAVSGSGQQGMQNTQLGQSGIGSTPMQNQSVVGQIPNQINQNIPSSQTVMTNSGVLGQTQIQQSQMGQNQVLQNPASTLLVSNQNVIAQPQPGQINQNVTQMGKIVSAPDMTQNTSNMNLPMTVLEGSGLDNVRGNQPFSMDLPGSVALLESLVEVTASGEQFVPNDDESVGASSRSVQGHSVSGGEAESVSASVIQCGSSRSRAPSPNPCSASGTTTGAIDNKIEQAMDLVKTHLMLTVREEVEVLKDKITELMDRISQLEVENTILKAHASQETLSQLSNQVSQKTQQPPNSSSS